MDWTAATAVINGILTDAGPIMLALVAVTAGIAAFKKIRGLIR